jgi:hypothetical protein
MYIVVGFQLRQLSSARLRAQPLKPAIVFIDLRVAA